MRRLPALLVVLLWAAHIVHDAVWLCRDLRPPHDDFAAHYQRAVKSAFHLRHSGRVLLKEPEGLRDGLNDLDDESPWLARAASAPIAGPIALGAQIHVSSSYPPLGYLVAAPVVLVAGEDPDAVVLAWDAVFLGVLFFALFRIGREIAGPWTGALAAAIAGFYPWVGGLARFLLLDVPLAATVSLAVAALLASRDFSDRRGSLAFGAAAGLAMLTKQIAPVFLAGPFLVSTAALWRRRLEPDSARRRANLAAAFLVGLAVAGCYYIPEFPRMVKHFFKIEAGGAVEGDLGRSDWANYAYYPVAVVEQAGAVGVVLLGTALVPFLVRPGAGKGALLLWPAGSWLLLSLITNKDLRYTVPYLPALALVTAVGIARVPWRGPRAAIGIGGVLVLGTIYVHSSWDLGWELLRMRTATFYEHPEKDVRIDLHYPVNPEFVPSSADWKTEDFLAILEGQGKPRGKVLVWSLAIMGEVTHAIEASQVVPEQEYRYGLREGYYSIDWTWKGEPRFVLVPSKHRGTSGARDRYLENVARWESIRHEFREIGTLELPEGFVVLVYRRNEGEEGNDE
ncbi:MAG: glycosyltransferase family 39 protein [Planctomycetes bacterium]|nr:glycosyltransferase family 39 protein [Planctomycetota bacterium]